jgi:hypothetical protein
MPHDLLAEYTLIHLQRDGAPAPPFVALETDRSRAEAQAIEWAQATFGDGPWRVVGAEFVGRAQRDRWGQLP